MIPVLFTYVDDVVQWTRKMFAHRAHHGAHEAAPNTPSAAE